MSSSTYPGNPDCAPTGFCPAPPPPPPPPPAPGQVPSLRISTAEAPAPRRARPENSNDPYEPPAAIQNAMMTKDKKPFTYTPGMGGKLDLSQIRSPRMARRVAKNANDEGIEGPPKSALESKTSPPIPGGNVYVQPQVAVPVFPTTMPVLPQTSTRAPNSQLNRVASNVADRAVEPPRQAPKVAATPVVVTPVQPTSPTSPGTPPVTLTKAPTPWLQNKNKSQEELPEWAKRTTASRSDDSLPESPVSPGTPRQIQPIQLTQQTQPTQQQQQIRPQIQQSERTIPLRIEDRPSVFSVKHEPGHHQLKQSTPHHQQRWGQQQGPSQVPMQIQQQRSDGARVIPIMVEDNAPRSPARSVAPPAFVQSPGPAQIRSIPVENQATRVDVQRGPMPGQQYEPGPLQSRAFRVLQKITDTDSDVDTDPATEQIRKLQLTEDDRTLMNKFKEQVDGDTYLHQEEDPRYRGAAIPSRAFRFLQNMTDSGEVPAASSGPRAPTAIQKKQQNRNSKTFEEAQANLPPSEQQVQEPKKYMGSAIPSRSFRILQAMTSPESVATQENRQPDFACQTENNMPGNQQGVFFPNCPSPYWNPDGGWWGYYPMQYAPNTNSNNIPYDSYAYYGYGDGNAYAYYPMYDQSYGARGYVDQAKSADRIETDYSDVGYAQIYPHYAATADYDQNYNSSYGQTEDTAIYNSVYPSPGDGPVLKSQKDSNVPKENLDLLTVPKWTSPSNTLVSVKDKSNDSRDTIRTSGSAGITDEEAGETTSLMKLDNGDRCNGKIKATKRTDKDADSSDEDSSDSSSSDSTSTSSDTDSDSDSDSDSGSEYLAYSTGLNPRERVQHLEVDLDVKVNLVEKESGQSLSTATISDDTYEHSSRLSSDKMSCSESDSDVDDEYQIESLNNDCILPHQLSVIYEDAEHPDADHRGLEARKDPEEKKDVPLEETDDPPDDVDDGDATTVSVSLPLRFKFSVSENDEDVTTVIVGDSLVKSEKSSSKEDSLTRSCTKANEDNDVHVNFQLSKSNVATANFTLKKQKSGETFDTELTLGTEEVEAQLELKESSKKILDVDVTDVDDVNDCVTADCEFTFKKDLESPVEKVDLNDNVETEFTVRTKKTDVTKHVWAKDLSLENETDLETRTSKEPTASDVVTECKRKIVTTNGYGVTNCDQEFLVTESKSQVDGDLCKEVTETKSLKIKESETVETEFTVMKLHPGTAKADEVDRVEQRNEVKGPTSAEQENERNVSDDHGLSEMLAFELTIQNGEKEYGGNDGSNFAYKEAKHLLSVQNSRDETDDEDSGVTSDMSRLISEVDTDSECAPNKKSSKYQRTQTHSRLFKLLNDDSILAEDSSEECSSPASREHLSLSLKKNVFNYDDNYYSNYSSGLTSPEYSPICEQSWRRLHDADNNADYEESARLALRQGTIASADSPNQKDPYFETWKTPKSPSEFDYDIVPSLTFKKLENRTAPFSVKRINVLCPRIRSSKNVPQALKSARAKPIVSSIPSPCYLKNDRC